MPGNKTKDKSKKIKVEEKLDKRQKIKVKSACSSGANYEESQGGSSKADFSNKVRISLREMRESNYWLRIIKRTVKEVNILELDYLIKESGELKNILGSIVQKSNPPNSKSA
jgi:four helix bundle protein